MGQIIINNRVFKDCKSISVTSFYVYICIRVHQFERIDENFNVQDIIPYTNIERATILRSMRDLSKLKYLKSKKSYNTLKVPYKRYSLLFHSCDIYGCSVFEIDLINVLIKSVYDAKINRRQFQILIYLLHRQYMSKTEILTISQTSVGRALGVTKNAINISLKQLNRDIFIKMKEEYKNKFKNINLLYN